MKPIPKNEFQFRVIAGELKGRLITAPDLGVTRPPLSRVRKSIFDFLNPYLKGAVYLDLFSGTGSYLFEAVSRGATKATGVEMEKRMADRINQQADKYKLSGRLNCINGDVFEQIEKLNERSQAFDIIMIAPPQYQKLIDRTLVSLKETNLLKSSGLILCQHDSSETKKTDFGQYKIDQHRKYGNTTFTILKQ